MEIDRGRVTRRHNASLAPPVREASMAMSGFSARHTQVLIQRRSKNKERHVRARVFPVVFSARPGLRFVMSPLDMSLSFLILLVRL